MQVLNGYQGVVFVKIAGEFVAGIFANMSNTSVDFGYGFRVFARFLEPFLRRDFCRSKRFNFF